MKLRSSSRASPHTDRWQRHSSRLTPAPGGSVWEARELPGHCREAVAYHLQLLNQAQLLCGSVQHSWTGQEQWVVHHLTLAGHDLLDRLRQESAAAAVPVRKSA